MQIEDALEKVGLTSNEIKVYLAVINLGKSSAGKVAKISSLHRRPTYDALSRLVEKGMVSFSIISGKRYFKSTNPNKILEIIKEKEEIVKEILPKIKEKYQMKKQEMISEIYEGRNSLKTIMEDILRERKEWLSLGSTGKGPSVLPFYTEMHRKRRVKLKIKRRLIFAPTVEGKEMAQKIIKDGLAEARFLPKEIKHPQTIWIYGNKVVIILVHIDHPLLILIENKDISESYREYFNWLWKIARK